MTANPGGPRVLVVDDTSEVRSLIRRALAAHGYQVDDAASLTQATALDPAGYDVILVDANLGAEKGVDLIDTLVAQDPAAAGSCASIVSMRSVPSSAPRWASTRTTSYPAGSRALA